MNSKKTNYKESFNLKATIVSIIILVVIIAVLIGMLFNADGFLPMVVSGILLMAIFILLSGLLIGILKGKSEVWKETSLIKRSNPYIYYRDLPNDFGIGVATLLVDSTLENYKDIIAVILDLCARGYLSLTKSEDKYVIKILKDMDDKLLSNEKYILYLLKSGNIKNINYQEWYNYCMQDGIDLGLYVHKDMKIKDELPSLQKKIEKRRKIHVVISVILTLVMFIVVYIPSQNIIKSIIECFVFFIIFFVLSGIPFYLINTISSFRYMGQTAIDTNYKNIMDNVLTKTDKGKEELQKLYSFKAFIKDFGHFAPKKVEEIVLWDRYLSYAQVFGLTNEIMKSGYKQLVQNASFNIDDIDNINLDNVMINK